jgi:aspartate-semialdehyde dehydrogenase
MRGYRIGLIGPRTPFGQDVRKLLSEGELPTIELTLFESGSEVGATLTQFGDDVVVTQPIDPDLFTHLDALLVGANDNDLLNRVAVEAGEKDVLTLVEGALGLGGTVVTSRRCENLRSGKTRLGILPRAESHLLGATLAAVSAGHEIERVIATILVPAHSMGDAGASELHQQIVHILNFKAPPTDVFQEQLAFNVRLVGASETGPSIADTVAWEASRIAGIEGALTVSLVQVPVFHGFSAALWVETKDAVDARTIRAAFRSKQFETVKSGRGAKSPSPVSTAGSPAIHIGPVRAVAASGPPGFWLWAVADSTAYDPATAAIEILRTILG